MVVIFCITMGIIVGVGVLVSHLGYEAGVKAREEEEAFMASELDKFLNNRKVS